MNPGTVLLRRYRYILLCFYYVDIGTYCYILLCFYYVDIGTYCYILLCFYYVDIGTYCYILLCFYYVDIGTYCCAFITSLQARIATFHNSNIRGLSLKVKALSCPTPNPTLNLPDSVNKCKTDIKTYLLMQPYHFCFLKPVSHCTRKIFFFT